MAVEKERLSNFANDSAAELPISSAKVDAELNQIIAALNQNVQIKSTAPAGPIDGQTWIDIGSNPPVLKIYDQTNAGWTEATVYGDFGAYDAKTTPVVADSLVINDSEDSDALKELTLTNLYKIITGSGVSTTFLNTLTSKGTPVLADSIGIVDSEAANVNKKSTLTSVKTAMEVAPLAAQIKAWANWDGNDSGTITPAASYGITSIVKSSTGKYVVTWATAFATAGYAISAMIGDVAGASGVYVMVNAQTTTTAEIFVLTTAHAPADMDFISIMAIGAQ